VDFVTCEQCGAKVAADEQFCPSCGAFIDPLAPKSNTPSRPPARPAGTAGNVIAISSDGTNYEEFSLEQASAPQPTAPRRSQPKSENGDNGALVCPSCGATNPSNNRHCQQCGARLNQSPLPKAPRPAVQATAGVRAAFYITALLFGVILVALLFNFFGGTDTPPTTTTTPSTTTTGAVENTPLTVIRHTCTPQGIGSFVCENLSNGVGTEFQVNWEELEANEQILTIRLDFDRAMTIDRIQWMNITDGDRFLQNHRARGLRIQGDQALAPLPWELLDTANTQVVDFKAVGAHFVTIEVLSTYTPQLVEGNIFRELAIDEIVVWGRPTD
jgi:ribosomal protein L40E